MRKFAYHHQIEPGKTTTQDFIKGAFFSSGKSSGRNTRAAHFPNEIVEVPLKIYNGITKTQEINILNHYKGSDVLFIDDDTKEGRPLWKKDNA